MFSLLILLGSTWYNLLRGVLEVAGGLVLGILLGFLIQYFPSVDQVEIFIIITFIYNPCTTSQLEESKQRHLKKVSEVFHF